MTRRLRATLWRYRWLLVAVCVAGAAWVALGELRPPPPSTTPVLVAARALPAGTVLTADDLTTHAAPSAPEGSVTAELAVGATLTVGLPPGLPIVETMLLGPGLADAAPPGWVVAPVPLADPVLAQLVRVGDRVDLYLAAADTGGRLTEATLVSAGALVLAQPAAAEATTSWLGGSSGSDAAVVVLALPASDAAALTGASGFGAFRAVLSAS